MHTEIHTRLHDARRRPDEDADDRIRRKPNRKGRVAGVHVFLSDENGLRGGLGTRCRLVVENARGGRLVATGRSMDADGALSAALQRARERIRRREERHLARVRTKAERRALLQGDHESQEAA